MSAKIIRLSDYRSKRAADRMMRAADALFAAQCEVMDASTEAIIETLKMAERICTTPYWPGIDDLWP